MSKYIVGVCVFAVICFAMSLFSLGPGVIVAIICATPAYIVGVGIARKLGLDAKDSEDVTDDTDPFIRLKVFALSGLPIAAAMSGVYIA